MSSHDKVKQRWRFANPPVAREGGLIAIERSPKGSIWASIAYDHGRWWRHPTEGAPPGAGSVAPVGI